MLQVASNLPADRNVIIITYNRSLADECKQRIEKLNLAKKVRCFTIHGLVTRVSGRVCNDDNKLNQTLDEWGKQDAMSRNLNSISFDLVMLDEAQDCRPLFHRLLSHIFQQNSRCRNNGMQLCLVGDPVSS